MSASARTGRGLRPSRWKGPILGWVVGLVWAGAVWGADTLSQYSARIWQTDDGLPHNSVQAIVQTRDGYLWVGTQAGLARFDGVHFTVFNRRNVPEMRNANILGLHESKDGSLWIATGTGGILRLKGGVFTHYGQAEGLAHNSTLGTICETPDGSLWFGTVGGVSRFKDQRFTTLRQIGGLSSDIVRDICEDRQGNVWFATSQGVDCWKDGALIRSLTTADGLKGEDARAVCCDRDGAVWIGAANGLSRFQDGALTTFSEGKGVPHNLLTCLYADRHGNLWVGGYGGLSRFREGKFIPQVGSDGLQFDLVRALFEDREDNLWVGSKDGLTQLRAKQFLAYTQKQGLANNNVMSVLEDRKGTMWFGTWGGGINRLRQGKITAYTNSDTVPLLVLAMHVDHAGRLWAGTDFDGGLFCLDGDSLRHYGVAEGLPKEAIRVIFEDRHTNLWVGTSAGLYRKQGGRFRRFGAKYHFGQPVVREVLEDRSGNLWVGTESGAWRFGPHAPVRFTRKNGLSSAAIIAIYQDSRGDLWFGTAGGGLNRFRNGRFIPVTTAEGLFNDTICEILEDDRGWLWLSCPRGVFRVNLKDLDALTEGRAQSVRSIAYGKGDGMLSELCNGVAKPGAWKSRDGRLWFATTKGVCVIDPSKQTSQDRPPPAVVLERVLADKRPFPAHETLPVTAPIRVPPGQGELEFHYTALSFRVPERNRFKYRLEGADGEWVDAGSRRVAYYNHIHPGTYRFRVIACSDDRVWNESGASVELVLLPHVWQTWWFKLAAAGGLGLLFFGWHRMRLGRVRQFEALRLRIAADLHDEVGSSLSTISLLGRKLQKDSDAHGEKQEDLAAISRIATQAAGSIREIVWFINPEYDTLQDLVLRMREAAGSILTGLDWRFHSPQERLSAHVPLHLRQNLFLLFKEALTNVAKHARASRVEIRLTEQDHTWQWSVQDDGVGFDPGVVFRGNGLKNMRLRAARLKGVLEIESRPGHGSTITFTMKGF